MEYKKLFGKDIPTDTRMRCRREQLPPSSHHGANSGSRINARRNIQGGRDEHSTDHSSYCSTGRRLAKLGLQPQLGLLSKRRRWADPRHPAYPRPARQSNFLAPSL
jgi:hypothetical protein